jgi:hypothetical protein
MAGLGYADLVRHGAWGLGFAVLGPIGANPCGAVDVYALLFL